MRVSGNFLDGKSESNAPNEYFVDDDVGVFFGGMEFFLSSTELYGLSYVDMEENQHPIKPILMTISSEAVKFRLENSIDLSFYVQREDGVEELIISAVMDEKILDLQVPYRPLKNSKTKSTGNGENENASLLVTFGAQNYKFDRPILDTSRRIINLNNKYPVVSYGIVKNDNAFNPLDFIISGAMEKTHYDEQINAWSARALRGWSDAINGGTTNEEIIAAYTSEMARHGNYSSAVSNISDAFKNSPSRTYLSTPFLGQLDLGLRTMSASEHSNTELYSTFLQDKSTNIFKPSHVFEYIALRDRSAIFDEVIAYTKTLDPSMINGETCAGVFEAWWAWWKWKESQPHKTYTSPLSPQKKEVVLENPFEIFIEKAISILQDSLNIDENNRCVFFVENNSVDVLYNIRLGVAIAEYGNARGRTEWAALGRSLVLSALSFAFGDGAVSSAIDMEINSADDDEEKQEGKFFVVRERSSVLSTTAIYKSLRFCDYYPHAVGAGSVYKGVWMWTISPNIAAAYENNVLDIGVNFPVGETHYILISGIGPFSKIQMRDMDYRSDPQFERYNSPGWSYSATERTLFVKLVHSSQMEHIKIFF
ncbi:hypothetical protein FACS1894102_2340 [Spirochaetia bacterium]|nr:hypothetical protein FACS1894102_2340 [Spirochaetia bacterium]